MRRTIKMKNLGWIDVFKIKAKIEVE